MAIIEINKDPSRRDLRWFGLVVLAFCGVIGGLIWWRAGSLPVARGFWGAGAILAVLYYAIPPLRKPMFIGWMYAAFPIGWLVSHVVLAIVYYLVITPIGLIMRIVGRDPMHRTPDPSASTYWREHDPHTSQRRYFRQF